VYDVATDTMDVPNGDLLEPLEHASVTLLRNGRPAIFGGETASGATAGIEIYTPDGGFNFPPRVQIRTPTALEPWAFGVRFNYRVSDQESDLVRIVPQFRIKPSGTDDSNLLPASILDKWLPATMKDRTVLIE